ncbi:unnamed protein product [Gongylonema pulchrum]|uniref:Septin-type G domain-containing protein n=1 Tax=Gongylonema pulchrum TaxID=637853 RepID=A0A3P6S071_9BILA|nr:unnamed protein product [Gongylonema pulchrum]
MMPLDATVMKHLHDRVNLLPVIAKADAMTAEELACFKKRILEDIAENGIKLYNFPDLEDEEELKELGPLQERVPFAVVGSNQVQKLADGRICRCRAYPWGTVEVENLKHSDFVALRQMIIRFNLIDMIDVTRSVHYENFRLRQLSKLASTITDRYLVCTRYYDT